MELQNKIRNRLDELEIEEWWDYGDYREIRDKDYTAINILNDALEELLTKEQLYECLGHFAYKYGITINGADIDKWLENLER